MTMRQEVNLCRYKIHPVNLPNLNNFFDGAMVLEGDNKYYLGCNVVYGVCMEKASGMMWQIRDDGNARRKE